MKKSSAIEWLSEAIQQAVKSSKFCTAGTLPGVDPGIEIEGLGVIGFPLKGKTAKALVAACQVAPYGKGTQTLVNKKVRNTLELDPTKFRVSERWNAAIAKSLQTVSEQLGLPSEGLEARLYKLLAYEKGGFFLPHRDSEKHDRMVASMIVVLPNQFEGGELIIRHGAVKQKLKFEEAANGRTACYAAFYADCEHEVQRVSKGLRLCLAYNLVMKPKRSTASAEQPDAARDVLAESIGSWVATRPAQPLVFALDHHYTERGLSLDLLKGQDRQVADLVVSAARKVDCLVHLAQVTRHLLQFADDGSYERSYYRRYEAPRREIKIGETYEDDLSGSEWADAQGKKQPWGEIALERSAIVSSTPLDGWEPTSEEFEGYTGNAGNTMDRWYHRSAIVVWHRNHHFNAVASAGAATSIPLLMSMATKLAKTPKKRFEEARMDCIRLADAIIDQWPEERYGWHPATPQKTVRDDFPERLLKLHNREVYAKFLRTMAERDRLMGLSDFVVAACREFGCKAFARELKGLLAERPDVYQGWDLSFRDVEWLSAFCCDKTDDADKSALAQELCALAVKRYCGAKPPRRSRGGPPSVAESSLPLLLKALAASRRDEDLARVIAFVEERPDEFQLDNCRAPCLKTLVPWSKREFGSVLPELASWLASVRQKLESATASRPAPPTDWRRPAEVDCKCQYCKQVNAFLADPGNEVGRIQANESNRQHVEHNIGRHECDVKCVLECKGSPYSLKLTKTTGSYERAVKRYEKDVKLLETLPKCV